MSDVARIALLEPRVSFKGPVGLLSWVTQNWELIVWLAGGMVFLYHQKPKVKVRWHTARQQVGVGVYNYGGRPARVLVDIVESEHIFGMNAPDSPYLAPLRLAEQSPVAVTLRPGEEIVELL